MDTVLEPSFSEGDDRRFEVTPPVAPGSGETIRVLRVLEYVGDRNWVEYTLSKSHVKGSTRFGRRGVIKSSVIGEFPEVMERGHG